MKRNQTKKKFFQCAASVCMMAGACSAQTALHLDPATSTVVNPVAAPIELLVLHHNDKGLVDAHQIVLAAPNAATPYTLPAGSYIADKILLDPTVPKRAVPDCAPGTARIKLTRALVKEQLAMTQRAIGQNMSETETAAAAKAALGTEQAMDEMVTRLNDPATAAKYKLMADTATTPQGVQQAQAAQAAEMGANLLMGGIGSAMANGAVISAHSEQSAKEAGALQRTLDANKARLTDIQQQYDNRRDLLAVEREFSAKAAAQLAGSLLPVEIAADRQIARHCTTPANDRDTLVMQMNAEPRVNLLIGRAHFDKGGDEDLIFNRIDGTPQWVATIYWPLEAASSEVALHSGEAWVKLGQVKPDRPSVEKQLVEARKSLAPMKKAERQAKFAAQGGDETRTTIIP